MGCTPSHHHHHQGKHAQPVSRQSSVDSIQANHGGILARARRKRRQHRPHGNLENLISRESVVAEQQRDLVASRKAALEDLLLFLGEEHDGSPKMNELSQSLNEPIRDAAKFATRIAAEHEALSEHFQELLERFRIHDRFVRQTEEAQAQYDEDDEKLGKLKDKYNKAEAKQKENWESVRQKLAGQIESAKEALNRSKEYLEKCQQEEEEQKELLDKDRDQRMAVALRGFYDRYTDHLQNELQHIQRAQQAVANVYSDEDAHLSSDDKSQRSKSKANSVSEDGAGPNSEAGQGEQDHQSAPSQGSSDNQQGTSGSSEATLASSSDAASSGNARTIELDASLKANEAAGAVAAGRASADSGSAAPSTARASQARVERLAEV